MLEQTVLFTHIIIPQGFDPLLTLVVSRLLKDNLEMFRGRSEPHHQIFPIFTTTYRKDKFPNNRVLVCLFPAVSLPLITKP